MVCDGERGAIASLGGEGSERWMGEEECIDLRFDVVVIWHFQDFGMLS